MEMRRPGERRLEVVELELRRLADDLRGGLRIADARKLDDDLVGALLADLRLRHAEPVDAAPHDLDRSVEVFGRQLAVGRRYRLERDLETSLEVEPERGLLVDRRSGHGQQRHADERGGEEADDDKGGTSIHSRRARLAAVGGGRVRRGIARNGFFVHRNESFTVL